MLENPVWAALSGPQACHAEVAGDAARYLPDISPFCAMTDDRDPSAWRDLAKLTDYALLTGPGRIDPPPGWAFAGGKPGLQMAGHGMTGVEDAEAILLGEGDLAEILELVELAQPGPFRRRTIELGRYLGLRQQGRLVAMAGERFHLPGWTEVSAVCTHPGFRGQGLAARLTLAVAAGILSRGELPFLHVAADNENAIRLYERLGFEAGHEVVFAAFRREEQLLT